MITEINEAVAKAEALLTDPLAVQRIVVSGRQRNQTPPFVRIDIRPVLLKAELHWQEVSHDGKKDITKNLKPNELKLAKYLSLGFANLLIETEKLEMSIRITKSRQAQVAQRELDTNLAIERNLSHDRNKERLLDESNEIFIALGISDQEGKLKPSKSDKFKQVQEFLRSIEASLKYLNLKEVHSKPISVVDLGCGHAYLTFAVYGYLKKLGYAVSILGVDEREDSRVRNSEISQNLGISNEMQFKAIKIEDLPTMQVDIAIALHACDTATDDAISWAVKSDAKVILVAPCCQHDLQKQIKEAPSPWDLVTRYGIMHERIGDILTDTIRAQTLRSLGYRTEIIEFIAGSHTPKNLMIRAFSSPQVSTSNNKDQDWMELKLLIEQWKVQPKLLDLLHQELNKLR